MEEGAAEPKAWCFASVALAAAVAAVDEASEEEAAGCCFAQVAGVAAHTSLEVEVVDPSLLAVVVLVVVRMSKLPSLVALAAVVEQDCYFAEVAVAAVESASPGVPVRCFAEALAEEEEEESVATLAPVAQMPLGFRFHQIRQRTGHLNFAKEEEEQGATSCCKEA